MRSKIRSASILVVAIMVGNLTNFLFNAILGRALSLEYFSILMLISTLWFVITILLNTLTSATNNRVAYLLSKKGPAVAEGFRVFLTRKSILFASILSLTWVVLTPYFSHIFHIDNYYLFLTIVPAIWLGAYTATNRGYFQGTLSFVKSATIISSESISKLAIAFAFIHFGHAESAYLAIPLSILVSFLVTLFFVLKIPRSAAEPFRYTLPKKLLTATFIIIFSSVAFLSVDLLLARHFLSAVDSGIYSLLSLVGKMIFFLGSILNFMILTLASREMGLKRDTANSFYRLLLINFGLLVAAFVGLGIFGRITVPLLLGDKGVSLIPYLFSYTLGVALFTLANCFATYHLAKQQFIFAVSSIAATVMLTLGILVWHSDLSHLVQVVMVTSSIYLCVNLIAHLLYRLVLEYQKPRVVPPDPENIIAHPSPYTVSICIPAYNEAPNIRHILKQLLKQTQIGFTIERIIVASDGSTDNTVEIVKEYASRGVEVIIGRDNRGQTYRQNQLIASTTSDILILLNADLLLRDSEVILRLITPITRGADLSAQWAKPVSPRTTLERILKAGFVMKNYIYTRYQNGNNIYTCVGHLRALSRRFYSSVVFPTDSSGEDQYLYLTCISGGFRYVYTHSHNLYFKLPDNFADYKNYARRIFQTQKKYDKTFNHEIVTTARKIPFGFIIRGCIYGLLKHPLDTMLYIVLHIVIGQWALHQPRIDSDHFEQSKSTKKFHPTLTSEIWR